MAEEKKEEKTEGEGQTAPASTSGKRSKLLIIGGVVFLVLISAGIPTTLLLMKNKDSEQKAEELDKEAASHDTSAESESRLAEQEEQIEEGEEVLGAIIPFDTFVVNLDGGRYARIQAQIEFSGLTIPRRFYSKVPVMRDTVITLLTQRTADQLLNAKGKENLRESIKNKLNEILKHEDVKRIYFTQFVVQ